MEEFDNLDGFSILGYDEAYEEFSATEDEDEFLATHWADNAQDTEVTLWSDEEAANSDVEKAESAPPNPYAVALDSLIEVTTPMTWSDDAACRSSGVNFFVEQHSNKAKAAKAICAVCPALKPCLEHALKHPSEKGIWGGTTTLQRKNLQFALRRNWLSLDQIMAIPSERFLDSLNMLTMPALKIASLLEDESAPLQDDLLRSALEKIVYYRQQINHRKLAVTRQQTARRLPEVLTPELWDDQIECLKAIKKALSESQPRIFFQMSPSRGKTTVAAMAVKEVFENNPEARVAFLCHRNEILWQAKRRFRSMMGNAFTYGTFTGDMKEGELNETTFVFATFQTLRTWRERLAPNAFDLIVVDESHHALAPTYKSTIDYFIPNTYLAMTATPRRTDLLDSQDIFGAAVYTQSLAENFVNGRLARPHYKVIVSSEEEAYWQAHSISPVDVDRRVFIPAREEEMVRIAQQEIEAAGIERPRILAFTNTMRHADRIARLLPNAKAWHTKSRDTIHEFREGSISALVAVAMADEGVDIPDINVLLFFNRTDSEPKFVQQLGRGARKTADKDSMLVLDFAANCNRLFMVEELVTDMLDVEQGRILDTAVPSMKPRRTRTAPESSHSDDHIRILQGGTFVYTPVVVKIIERIRQMDQEALPEGWVSTASFARTHDISSQLLFRLLSDMAIDNLPVYRTKYNQVIALSPELQARLLETPELQTKRASEDILSLPQFARQVGMQVKRLKTVMKHEGIDADQLPRYKFGSVTTYGVPPDIQIRIRMSRLLDESLPIPEGWVSVEKFSQLMSTHRSVIQRLIKTYQLPIVKRRVGSIIAPVLSPEQQTFLQKQYDFTVQPAPDGWVGIATFATKNRISVITARKIIEKYDVLTERYKYGNVVTETLSPWSQQCILKIIHEIEPTRSHKGGKP